MWFTAKEKVITDDVRIDKLLTRGVEEVFVKDELLKKLRSGKQLRVKLGFDPTGSKIHIGRAIVLRKLKAFQDLGHKIIFIVGDYTAQIGDPSDKLDKRPMLTVDKIKENLKDYKKQVGTIVDLSKAEFHYNSQWLKNLTFAETCNLAEAFTVQQMLGRRNFSDRYEQGKEISVREFLYPLMQGYDSVMVKADVELGGFDQLFNLKAGRIVQKYYGMAEQDVLITQMLEGTDGRKMSTSWGNVINITDQPNDMYGKVMALRDDLILKYFLLTTDVSEVEIEAIKNDLQSSINPKEAKMRLAREIVSQYHGADAARKAEVGWTRTFSEKEIPDDIRTISSSAGVMLKDLLVEEMLVPSKSEYTRLVGQGAIQNLTKGEKVSNPNELITETSVYKIGKKQFIKIEVK